MMKRSMLAAAATAVLLAGGLAISGPADARAGADRRLQEHFDAIMREYFRPGGTGVAALVAEKGRIVYRNAFGMANVELGVPMRPEMVFRIGSVTKQFTAVAILQLAEQGKLSLDDDITMYIEDFPTHGHTITIHHLLTHTSGIASYTGMQEWTPEMRRKDFTPREMIDFFKDQPMDFAPGEEFRYNNSAFFMLGYIIEKVSGMEYAAYVREKLFEPAGMEHSLYGDDRLIVKNRACGYQAAPDGIENAAYISMTQPYAAGALMSTVEDLLRWNVALRDGRLLRPETLALAHADNALNSGRPTNYGYGWFLGDLQGSPVLQHGGGINGYLAQVTCLPDEDVLVILLTNCTCISPVNAASRIAALAAGKSLEFEELALDPGLLEDYSGVYVNRDGDRRAIYAEDERLYSIRNEGPPMRLLPYAPDRFFFENSLTVISFRRGGDGIVAGAVTRTAMGFPDAWEITDLPLPEKQVEIRLAVDILAGYVGKYELAPGFILTVFLDGDSIMAQATGQQAVEIFALEKDRFFLKAVAAKIEFTRDDEGRVAGLILSQGGRDMPAARIE